MTPQQINGVIGVLVDPSAVNHAFWQDSQSFFLSRLLRCFFDPRVEPLHRFLICT